MSIQTELMISDVNGRLSILEINEKQTMFTKKHIAPTHENRLRTAIRNDDGALLEEVLAELMAIAYQTGFDKAPGAYMMKHHGYMFGMGLLTRSGIRSDMTFTCRTASSLR